MPAKKPATRKPRPPQPPALAFNHAMIYSRDVAAALRFYRDLLGFRLVDDYRYRDTLVYARLLAPKGEGSIALHGLEPGKSMPCAGAIRLYFEVRQLDKLCVRLRDAGFAVDPPKLMPWGWSHTYLNDPDGHELSLYWAGAARLRRTMQK